MGASRLLLPGGDGAATFFDQVPQAGGRLQLLPTMSIIMQYH